MNKINFFIMPEDIDNFQVKILKLNKKLEKLGLPIINIFIKEPKVQEINYLKVPKKMLICEVILSYEQTYLNGYEFIATLDHKENIIYTLNTDIQFKDFLDNPKCDHCKTNHKRGKTFILRKDNKLFQVGSTCLKDFIQSDKVEDIISLFQIKDKYINYFKDENYFNRPINYIELDKVISYTYNIIKQIGFVKKDTNKLLWNIVDNNKEILQKVNLEMQNSFIKEIKEYVKNMNPHNDFLFNIKNIFKNGYVTRQSSSFLVGFIANYLNKKAENKNKQKSKYIGKIGEKISIEVSFKGVNKFITYYGRKEIINNIYKFIYNDNSISWFTTTNNNFEVGKLYKLEAIVKKHEEYKNEKITYIKNVKIL